MNGFVERELDRLRAAILDYGNAERRDALCAAQPESSVHGSLRAISPSVANVRRRWTGMPTETATR